VKPTRGGPPAWGLGKELTTPKVMKITTLRNVTLDLGFVRILWQNFRSKCEGEYLNQRERERERERERVAEGWRKLYNEEFHNVLFTKYY
jgi:hypothetical protein